MSERRTDLEIEVDAYGAYLIARATGKYPHLRDKTAVTVLDRYAIALGVHHFHRGTKPISFRTLLGRADSACRGMGGLGPSPHDPGGTGEPQPAGIAEDSHQSEVERLADYLEKHFPGEPGRCGPPEGETAVDVAVRLLEELRSMRLDGPLPSPGPWAALRGLTRLTAAERAVRDGLALTTDVPDSANPPDGAFDLHFDAWTSEPTRARALTWKGVRWIQKVLDEA